MTTEKENPNLENDAELVARNKEVVEVEDLNLEEIKKEVEVSDGEIINGQKVLNLWLFFNILCQYATHRVSPAIRLEMSRRISKMF